MATPAEALTMTGGTVNYTNPAWLDQYLQQVAGAGSTLTAGAGTPGSIANNMANWNIDPTTGKPNPLYGDWNSAYGGQYAGANAGARPSGYLTQAGNTMSGARADIDTTAGGLNQVSAAIPGTATYDPSKVSQFMNPYTQDAATATVNLSNKNLFENILPKVNSTFVGSGQFGSTRNADFENRAIRDQQKGLTDALGTLNYGATKDAAQQYQDWAKLGLAGAEGQRTIASTQGDLYNKQAAIAEDEASLGTQNLENLGTAGKNYLDWQNGGYGATYTDFQNQLKYPLDAMGALTNVTNALKGQTEPDRSETPGELSDWQKATIISQLLAQTATGTGTAGTGPSTLDEIAKWWDEIF